MSYLRSIHWTAEQRSFEMGWRSLREAYVVESLSPRALWPEENTDVLQFVQEARNRYYTYLEGVYFDHNEIVLELGSDTRRSWTNHIDSERHVVVRTSWSQRSDNPEIWQIPLDELLAVLHSPQWSWLASKITTIVMENTLDCLEQPLLDGLFRFARQYRIRVVALKYRPLSAPSLEKMQNSGRQRLEPQKECPALVLAAQELMYLVCSTWEKATEQRLVYLYRPPIGSPIALCYPIENNLVGHQQLQDFRAESSQSKGAVRVLLLTSEILENGTVFRQMLSQFLMLLLSVHDKPESTYRVHMMKSAPVPQVTLVQLWAWHLLKEAERAGLRVVLNQDCVGVASEQELLHNSEGELIEPQEFIDVWKGRGFPEDVLRRYAYGTIGDARHLPSVKNNWIGEKRGQVFQAFRL